jgi:hypothetical protein
MDECRYYYYGVGDEMYQLQFVVEEKSSEEVVSGDVEPTLEETPKTTCSLMSSVGKASPVGAFHSTSAIGLNNLQYTNA